MGSNKTEFNRAQATSILCDVALLEQCELLTKIAQNGNNAYYEVENSNTTIMHVANGYNILIDSKITTFDGVKNVSLPIILSNRTFCVSRQNLRDWIKSGTEYIGYIIKGITVGPTMIAYEKALGKTLDHAAETYNEKCCHTSFKYDKNDGSHRVQVNIQTMGQLEQLIEDIQIAESEVNGVYLQRNTKNLIDRGRNFVKK